MRALLLVLVASAALACATRGPAPAPSNAAALPNGLYALLSESPAETPPAPVRPPARTFFHDRRRADPTTDAAPSYVTLDTADYVPLVLARRPESVLQPDGRIRLDIALAEPQVPVLAAFTTRHVGGRAAIVLDGEIVTVHKVRSVIPDGRLMVSRCSDRACDRIFSKLVHN